MTAHAAKDGPLISVRDASALHGRSDVVFFDCRFSLSDTAAGKAQWRAGHIPSAHYAHLDDDLSGTVIQGTTGRHPFPGIDDFATFLSKSCVTNETLVVVYDDSGGPFAARLWWLLKYAGHERVLVLDGGWTSWRVAGLPVDDHIPEQCVTEFEPNVKPQMVATADDVACASGAGTYLIDARAAERYAGREEPIDAVAGHIPGALSFPYKANLNEDGTFRSAAELKARFADLGGGAEVISYCGSGVTAAHNALAMQVAGLKLPRLYVGSWSEWITDAARGVATE